MMRRSAFRALVLAAVLTSVQCTPEDAAPWGKAIFGFMIVALVAIPLVFWIAWRRRTR